MAKLKEVFVCQNCGAPSPKWQGQCATCGEWNTLVAETAPSTTRKHTGISAAKRVDISTSLAAEAVVESPRLPTGSVELDRVLGGGLVPGSVTLIGGDPGIGKSTLMLQAAAALNALGPVLYATGEESLKQVALRARRLGLDTATARLITETGVEDIVAAAAALGAKVLIVDSIQTTHSERVDSAPGAVSQLRECTAELVRFAKASGTAVLLVGHVTKEGQIAGPRVLEHMVDTVLYFESDTGSRFRVLRSVKNRFGAANEIGVFAMVEARLARSHQSLIDILVAACRAGVGQRDHGDARRHACAADRSASVGGPELGDKSAPCCRWHRWQSLDHVAGRGASPRGTATTRTGRVRQCRRRSAHG